MPEPQRCLYTLIHAPQEQHDALLQALVRPVVQRIREDPALVSLFFARYDRPDWQLRFRVLGQPEWVEGPVRQEVSARLPGLRQQGLLQAWEFATYQREWERYGGEHGMLLCEQLFLHDSLACIDLLHAEASGTSERTRREYSLVYTERFLDLLGFDRAQRIEVYRKSFQWAIEGEDWSEADRALLEERFRALEAAMVSLFTEREDDSVAGQIARRCLRASRGAASELRRGLITGQVVQDPVHLAWSLCHMHCNRIGLDIHAEAVLRYFAHRLHQNEAIPLGIPPEAE